MLANWGLANFFSCYNSLLLQGMFPSNWERDISDFVHSRALNYQPYLVLYAQQPVMFCFADSMALNVLSAY